MDRRSFLARLGTVPLAAGLAPSRAVAQPARALTPVVVNVTTPVDVVTFYYSAQQKLFERAGLDLTYQIVPSGAVALIAVVGGAANIGFGNPFSLVTAYLKGAPIQLLAPGGEYLTSLPNSAIFVLPDSPIRTGKDLEDRAFAVTGLHDLMAIAVRGWADANGGDSAKIRFVEMPPSAMLAALQAKRVDAIGAFEPFRSEALAAGARAIGSPYDAIAKQFITGAWFGNTTWIGQHRDAAIRFAEVIRAAGEYANAHYDELIPLMSSYSKIPSEVLQRSNRVHFPSTLSPAAIQPMIDIAAKYHEIAAPFRAQDMILRGVP